MSRARTAKPAKIKKQLGMRRMSHFGGNEEDVNRFQQNDKVPD